MTKEEQQKRRIRFSWRDGAAILAVILATAGVFVWSSLAKQTVSKNSHAVCRYNNKLVAENLTVINQSGVKMEYTVSFRRALQTGESYTLPSDYVSSYAASVELTVYELRKITDFSLYAKKYLIVTSDAQTSELEGFDIPGYALYGPQVDLKVSEGGIRVIKEDSPQHVCSNQGQVNEANLPVVCLPNHLVFQLVSQVAEPDA
jgi:hypothetical protein